MIGVMMGIVYKAKCSDQQGNIRNLDTRDQENKEHVDM